jgi:RimJ/RimL family protein N-acetyltransferase
MAQSSSIEGLRVRLVEPFPEDRLPDLFHWLKVSMLSRTSGFPVDPDSTESLKEALAPIRTWAVFDKSDNALIGAVMFEPVGTMGGTSYVVAVRRAWGTGLMDEAAKLGIRKVFTDQPELEYIFGFVLANNAPARAFDERVGFRLKNVLPQYAEQGGKLRDMRIYEITREQWERQQA